MEHIRTAKVENVKLVDKITPKSSPVGTLYLTTSHLIFIDEKEKKELWILHMWMQSIEKPVLTTAGSQLKILCSNFLSVTFMISVSSGSIHRSDFFNIIQSFLKWAISGFFFYIIVFSLQLTVNECFI